MKNKKTKKTFIILGILFLLIFFHYLGILSPLENSVRFVLRPLQSGFTSLANTLGNQVSLIFTRKNLWQDNQQLRQQIIKLWSENNQLKHLEQENTELKIELKYQQENPDIKFITAKIIAQDSAQNPALITINAGEKQGLSVGLPVLVDQGVIIGRLETVNKNTSQIILLTHNKSRLAASFTGLNNSSGIITGQHNISLKMILIPADIVAEEGSAVVTSGTEQNIPAGYLIGHITNITHTPNDLFQSAEINPIVDYYQIRYVIIPLSKYETPNP